MGAPVSRGLTSARSLVGALAAGFGALLIPVLGAGQEGAASVRPTPRLADGTVNLGSAPGEIGYWNTLRGGALMENAVALNEFIVANAEDVDRVAPFKPWSRQLFLERQANLGKDDPHLYCAGNGGPRMFDTPYGIDFIQDRARERILIKIGWSRRWREIFLDGRSHPDPDVLSPGYFGHSVGHWDGDTLVIDTVGFNERFWFARKPTGIVHTDALHLVERISRPNYETLRYEVTIDDPKAYARPWTVSWELPWSESEMVEYLCAENPRGYSHIVGPQ